MKGLLIIVVLAVAGYFAWQKFDSENGPRQKIDNPVYGEVRVTADIQGREIEMALFIRASSDADCHGRAQISWSHAFKSCPACELSAPKCQAKLPPRYARLFDDVPIPSAYLSATAGRAGERDGRVVVYGLTDAEGVALCEELRTYVGKEYRGQTHCVPPSGG